MGMLVHLSGLSLLLGLAACQPPAPDNAAGNPAPDKVTTASAHGTAVRPSTAAARPLAPARPAVSTGVEHWQCGEILLDARVDGPAIRLSFSGRSLLLPHVESLTGARYADAVGNAFTRSGDGANLILAGEDARDCSSTTHTSPWIDAAGRGIGFRAVGSEPGWFVEVGQGEAPPLHATLDYGDGRIDLAHMQPAGMGFTGNTSNGMSIALKIQRASCRDGMSGEAFEATAQLTVDDKTYHGCGAFLAD